RISMRRSASSRRAWQKRERCTPRSYSCKEDSSGRSPSSSFFTMVSSSAIAASKSLMVESTCVRPPRLQPAILDLARQLAALDGDGDRVADGHVGGVADHGGPIAVPAHSIASSQYGERAQALEFRRRGAEMRLEPVTPAIDRGGQLSLT